MTKNAKLKFVKLFLELYLPGNSKKTEIHVIITEKILVCSALCSANYALSFFVKTNRVKHGASYLPSERWRCR